MAHLLIIDDDIKESGSLRTILEKNGHRISVADTGELGIKIINDEMVDCIFFNINMPGINGFQFLKDVPESLRRRSVILTSGTSLAPLNFVIQLANCHGALGALKKPVKVGPLLQIVEKTLAI